MWIELLHTGVEAILYLFKILGILTVYAFINGALSQNVDRDEMPHLIRVFNSLFANINSHIKNRETQQPL